LAYSSEHGVYESKIPKKVTTSETRGGGVRRSVTDVGGSGKTSASWKSRFREIRREIPPTKEAKKKRTLGRTRLLYANERRKKK